MNDIIISFPGEKIHTKKGEIMSKPRKLPSGNWNIRVMVNGKSYSFTDPDKRTVKRMAAAFADQCREDIDNPKFIDAISDYIDRRSAVLSPASIRGYRSIEKMLRLRHAKLCQKRLIAVTDRDIQTVIDDLSFKTAKNYVGLIQAATKRKYDVVIAASRPNEMKVPDDLEIAGLIRIFEGTEMEIPVLLAVFGGLRRGEICALTMQDIDGDYVVINKDKVKDEFGCWVTKQPKTQKSNRRVLLPHFVIEKIRAAGHITTLNPHQVSMTFQHRQESLGVTPPYCFHSLRHYASSFLHANQIPDAYIMRRFGWASPSVMQKVYRHALADRVAPMEQSAVSAFQKAFQISESN